MVVRWLGAFRKGSASLEDALRWELSRSAKAVAAERLKDKQSAMSSHCKVGLIVKGSAVLRRFRSDVWSETNQAGNLVRTRPEYSTWSEHTECWVRQEFVGVIVRPGVSSDALTTCRKIALEFDLPLLTLSTGGGAFPLK